MSALRDVSSFGPPRLHGRYNIFVYILIFSIEVFIKIQTHLEIEWRDYLRIFDTRMWLLVIVMVVLLAVTDIFSIWAMKIYNPLKSRWIIYERIFHYFQTICCYQGKK